MTEANDRLIDAAPDLLAALTKLSNEVLGIMPLMDYAILIKAAEEARAVISKATRSDGAKCE
jgi:hypothetical protein